MHTIFSITMIIILIVISLVFAIGIPLGIGWVLTLFLPFSLFEGTLLSMIAAITIGAVWYRIFLSAPITESTEEEEDYETYEIPESRFWKRSTDKTWENWLRYELANSIYEDLLDSPRLEETMNKKQLQDTSIHLADAAIRALKAKSPRAKRFTVNRGTLKQGVRKLEQRPYADEILDIAVAAVNTDLMYFEEIKRVVRKQLWDEPAEVY